MVFFIVYIVSDDENFLIYLSATSILWTLVGVAQAQMEWSSYEMMDPRVLGDGPLSRCGEKRAQDPGSSRMGPPPNSGRTIHKIEGGWAFRQFWGNPLVDLP